LDELADEGTVWRKTGWMIRIIDDIHYITILMTALDHFGSHLKYLKG